MRKTRTLTSARVALLWLLMSCSGHSEDSPTGPVQPTQPAPVATVSLVGLVPLQVGQTVQLTAILRDASENVLYGRLVSWSSSLPSVATVSDSGLLTGIAPGSTTITASIEGKSGTGSVIVANTVVATVSLGYSRITMALREVLPVLVTARDSAGKVIPGKTSTLKSSDPAVVAINADGSLLAQSTGSATVTGSIDGISVSVPVTAIAFASITALSNDVCALTSTGVMYCAGAQFGSGARPVAPEIHWVQVVESGSDDGAHLCGVTTQGSVMCWGANAYGELGVGDLLSHNEPTLAPIPESVTQVTTGAQHTCALTVGGSIYCWGDNSFGQVGDGSTTRKTTAVRVASDEKFTQVAAAGNHTCGLTDGGAILCWGENGVGQLGRGTWSTTDPFPTPAPVKSDLRFKSISSYTSHPCALAVNGAAYCWGGNTVFQTGQSTTEVCYSDHPCVTVPSPVTGGLTFDIVVSSDFGACGLTSAGTAHCWGMDAQSMLGAAPGSVPLCPVTGAVAGCTSNPLPGPVDFKTLTAGLRNYCGMRFDGGAYCWGGNRYGQMGAPTPEESAIPIAFAIAPDVSPP